MIYGDARGGFVIGDSLKLSLLEGPNVFGLHRIEELQGQQEIQRASALDPQIAFFMDSANVWFYGIKAGELFVYDAETAELDSLGPVDSALRTLLLEFDEAAMQ
jgi:hypothetical protein